MNSEAPETSSPPPSLPSSPGPSAPGPSTAGPTARARLLQIVMLAVIAWCALALGSEILDNAQRSVRLDSRAKVRPQDIRLGGRHEAVLEKFLHRVEGAIPTGETVCLLAAPAMARRDYFFLSLWVAYLLPQHHVRRTAPARIPPDVQYCVAVRSRYDRASLRLVFEGNQGALYRVRG